MASTDPTRSPGRDPFGWLAAHRTVVDLAIWGSLALLNLVLSGIFWLVAGADALFFLVSALMCGVMTQVHRYRAFTCVTVIVIAAAHFLIAMALLLSGWTGLLIVVPGDLLIFCAVYYATESKSASLERFTLTMALVGCVLLGAFFARGETVSEGIVVFGLTAGGTGGVVLASWAIGRFRKAQRIQRRLAEERAEAMLAEQSRATDLAVARERNRIAREMHDIVAHSLSVIIAQSDAGRYAAESSPAAASGALETIGETGRTALADMRQLLGVLREGNSLVTAPQQGTGDLDELIGTVRDTGLAVDYTAPAADQLAALPPQIGMALYRVTQESLTNVLKHAGPAATARVAIQLDMRGLFLEVPDTGRGAAAVSDGRGQGLTGMRERATATGGTFESGPYPGGFAVRAFWPPAALYASGT